MVDPHDQMETTRPKWSKNASELNLSGHSPLWRNGMAFKDKSGMHVWWFEMDLWLHEQNIKQHNIRT